MDLSEARQLVQRRAPSRVDDGDYFALTGGLNLSSAPLQITPGELIGAYNYEPRTMGGYERFQGYERLDGRTPPSKAPYYILNFISGTPANYPTLGQTVNGQTSGATGIVLLANVLNVPNTTGYLILWTLTGTFVNGENLRVVTTAFGVASGTATAGSAGTDVLDTAYSLAAREAQRALIGAVPGSGPILGVVVYNGVDYAFRNNVGGTAAVMYKATSSGWTAVPAFPVLNFSLGTSPIVPGNTITGVTSTNTATVRRVVLSSGSWDAGTAAGYLILAAGSPGFVTGEILNVSAVASATTVGTAVAPVLAPNGDYDFRVKNFYGNTATTRLYGADGVNQAFEYQDSPEFFCQIRTGMAVDAPTYLAAHRSRLWLAFRGGSLQPSGINDVVVYSALQGAAELGIGTEITGFLEEMSPSQSAFYSTSNLFVFTQSSTFTITGDGPNWILGPYAPDLGAFPSSMQRMGQGIFLNDRGFASLTAVAALGNFAMSSFSNKIDTLMSQIKQKVACSSISRNKNMYRLFLSDGTFLSIGFKDGKVIGHTVCDMSVPITCSWTGTDNSHNEHILAGSSNGYVYQVDSGVNIDGAAIIAFFRTAYGFAKSPSRQKRYRRAQADVYPTGPCTLSFVPDYSFGDPAVQADPVRTIGMSGGGGFWDVALWDQFKWDAAAAQAPTIKLEGSGLNVAFVVSHTSTNEPPHVVQGISLHLSKRRLDRSSQT